MKENHEKEIHLSELIKGISKIIIVPDARTFDMSQLRESELTEISEGDDTDNPENT